MVRDRDAATVGPPPALLAPGGAAEEARCGSGLPGSPCPCRIRVAGRSAVPATPNGWAATRSG